MAATWRRIFTATVNTQLITLNSLNQNCEYCAFCQPLSSMTGQASYSRPGERFQRTHHSSTITETYNNDPLCHLQLTLNTSHKSSPLNVSAMLKSLALPDLMKRGTQSCTSFSKYFPSYLARGLSCRESERRESLSGTPGRSQVLLINRYAK